MFSKLYLLIYIYIYIYIYMHVWDHGTYVLKIGQVSCLIYVAHILKGQSKLGLEYGQAPSDEKKWGRVNWDALIMFIRG